MFAKQQMTGNIFQSAVLPEGIQQWHHCVSLLATILLGDGVDFAKIVAPTNTRILPISQSGKRHHGRVYFTQPFQHARREIKSNAPIPSTEVTVACGSNSVRLWRAWATHSQPAVVIACWHGLVARSTAAAVTSRRITSPATMPRTPPSGLDKAVNIPIRTMLAGTCASATL